MTTNPGFILAAQRRQIPHTCPVCGQGFTGIKTARFCSNACKQRDKYIRRKKPAK